MLHNVNAVLNYVLLAEDGEIGRCKDFLFDDEKWTIRYLVADTRKWMPGRKVLISPMSLGEPDWSTHRFQVELTRRQIEDFEIALAGLRDERQVVGRSES